jgi:hypothetical protein
LEHPAHRRTGGDAAVRVRPRLGAGAAAARPRHGRRARAWHVVGLPLHGADALWPLALAAAGGWAAWWVRGRSAPDHITLPS